MNQLKRNAIELFILRARRVLTHSLFVNDRTLLQELHEGKYKITIVQNRRTGEETQHLSARYPTEEQLESLAARIRPIILEKEEVHYRNLLNELDKRVPEKDLSQYVEPTSWWRNAWEKCYNKTTASSNEPSSIQAYKIITENNSYSDSFLMDRWLYGDLVHADDLSKVTTGVPIKDRFHAAAHSIARIAIMVEATYYMLTVLNTAGLLPLEPTCLTEEVSVSEPGLNQRVRAYTAPLSSPLPNTTADLDETWKSVSEAFLMRDS